MSFELWDVVKIVKEPQVAGIKLVGTVGLVLEVRDAQSEFVFMEALEASGKMTGTGWLPCDCLELVESPEWMRAGEIRKQEIEARLAEGRRYHEAYTTAFEGIAERHDLTPEKLKAIHEELLVIDDPAWNGR